MRETKTRLSKLLVILISAGAVLFSAVPAFASTQSIGTVDRDIIPSSDLTISLWIPNNQYIYVPENNTDFVVPVYAFLPISDVYNYGYLSGMARYNCFITQFGYPTGTPVNVYYDYFESVSNDDLMVIWGKNGNDNLKIYFDNYRIDGLKAEGFMLLGYMHFKLQSAQHSGFTLYFPNNNNQYGPAGHTNVYCTAYEYGFAESIIYALDTATSVQDILDTLNDIDQNSGYLPEIFTELQTRLPQLYSLIQQVFNTDQAILSVNQDTYRTILSILAILQNAYGVQESHAEEVADDIEQNMSNLAHDIELTKPSAVANIADDYINQIDTSFNASIFGSLFNPIVILMLCVVFAFAILSYMLYGGQ